MPAAGSQQHRIIGEMTRHLDDSICSMFKGAFSFEGEGRGIGDRWFDAAA
jgi:hypothetical protein